MQICKKDFLNYIDELGVKCSPWPDHTQIYQCDGKHQDYEALNRGLKITQTHECEQLCKKKNSNGCCALSPNGCFWMKSAKALKSERNSDIPHMAISCETGTRHIETYHLVYLLYHYRKIYENQFALKMIFILPLVATCNDGLQNQGEVSVDCGGPCPACGK